eukprot:TRINITY_DN4366_c0_g1_i4.p1 TRINITY_DN4366_c0_g1~~TRINITY_DN4366_c0_g1_i4.p1  ORF type:complete len:938 (-),score=150.07 TRINITY_DN4366_c0_g1_i4:240-3053(-)
MLVGNVQKRRRLDGNQTLWQVFVLLFSLVRFAACTEGGSSAAVAAAKAAAAAANAAAAAAKAAAVAVADGDGGSFGSAKGKRGGNPDRMLARIASLEAEANMMRQELAAIGVADASIVETAANGDSLGATVAAPESSADAGTTPSSDAPRALEDIAADMARELVRLGPDLFWELSALSFLAVVAFAYVGSNRDKGGLPSMFRGGKSLSAKTRTVVGNQRPSVESNRHHASHDSSDAARDNARNGHAKVASHSTGGAVTASQRVGTGERTLSGSSGPLDPIVPHCVAESGSGHSNIYDDSLPPKGFDGARTKDLSEKSLGSAPSLSSPTQPSLRPQWLAGSSSLPWRPSRQGETRRSAPRDKGAVVASCTASSRPSDAVDRLLKITAGGGDTKELPHPPSLRSPPALHAQLDVGAGVNGLAPASAAESLATDIPVAPPLKDADSSTTVPSSESAASSVSVPTVSVIASNCESGCGSVAIEGCQRGSKRRARASSDIETNVGGGDLVSSAPASDIFADESKPHQCNNTVVPESEGTGGKEPGSVGAVDVARDDDKLSSEAARKRDLEKETADGLEKEDSCVNVGKVIGSTQPLVEERGHSNERTQEDGVAQAVDGKEEIREEAKTKKAHKRRGRGNEAAAKDEFVSVVTSSTPSVATTVADSRSEAAISCVDTQTCEVGVEAQAKLPVVGRCVRSLVAKVIAACSSCRSAAGHALVPFPLRGIVSCSSDDGNVCPSSSSLVEGKAGGKADPRQGKKRAGGGVSSLGSKRAPKIKGAASVPAPDGRLRRRCGCATDCNWPLGWRATVALATMISILLLGKFLNDVSPVTPSNEAEKVSVLSAALMGIKNEKVRLTRKIAMAELTELQRQGVELISQIPDGPDRSKIRGFVADALKLREALEAVPDNDFPQVQESFQSVMGKWKSTMQRLQKDIDGRCEAT